ncbi:permease-like cell division protein FtsX [Actinoplanes sp. NEAU-A12]|uniref:Permease-like cell division protein FtsX n=1 Tax=Actinoplanes sandaracinus TaxID=3045177 RepID=A0ABT6WYP8_9ACTN|nr:permease-like cell division protein FtsX [Actinoplanes sandaracinus]MDI6104857.1 permease-like cell division protein FtsX [Actinoplanes sandaracinus]
MTAPELEGPVSMTDIVESGEPSAPAVRRARPVRLAGVCALVGAIVAVAVLLVAGWRAMPVNRYEVLVFLDAEATAEQRETIRVALNDLPYKQNARPRTKAESRAEVKKLYAAAGDSLPETASPESVAESLMVRTSGRAFDCSPLAAVTGLPGVANLLVNEYRKGRHLSSIAC